jgi:hypothetical protein
MAKKRDKAWIRWFDTQSPEDQRTIALNAVERLMETEEVSFRIDNSKDDDGFSITEGETVGECLYWDSCGEDLRCRL